MTEVLGITQQQLSDASPEDLESLWQMMKATGFEPQAQVKAEKPKKAKRPPSAYINFSTARGKEIRTAMPGIKFGEVSKLCSTEWKELTDEQKSQYKGEL